MKKLFVLLLSLSTMGAYAQKAVQLGKLWGFEDAGGKSVIPAQFDEARDFNDGMAAVKKGKLWGFIDETGKLVIDYKYKAVMPFNDGYAVVGDCYSVMGISIPFPSKNVVVINKEGTVTGKFTKKDAIYTFGLFSDGMAPCVRTPFMGFNPKQYYGFINTKGELVIDCKYTLAENFIGGVAKVTSPENGGGYIDKNENFYTTKESAYLAVTGQEPPAATYVAANASANSDLKIEMNYPKLAVQSGSLQSKTESDTSVGNRPAGQSAVVSDVDINIPVSDSSSENTFVLIIANENYSFVDDVDFALNDGKIFREYCIKTLGVPERQVWFYENASLGIIAGGVDKMAQAMNIFDNAKAIVYYCGHGIPDEKSGDAYIVPVDGRGTNLATCYSLNNLYKTMASAKTANVTYFMDACFTGANRDGSMLVAARGVAREPKKEVIEGDAVVFSAASGDETAMPFREKGHGLFTYFLLKKLQQTKGDVTYGELAEYINANVRKEAFLTNEKPQNPVVATSENLSSKWKSVSLK